jgi:hypothetical protein
LCQENTVLEIENFPPVLDIAFLALKCKQFKKVAVSASRMPPEVHKPELDEIVEFLLHHCPETTLAQK